jgi:putative heme transporter
VTDPGQPPDVGAADELGHVADAAPRSTRRKVVGVVIRLVVTFAALAVSAVVLSGIFEDLDWDLVTSSLRSLDDAQRLSLFLGLGLVIAAQGLVTAATVPGLPVRRGVLAYLAPSAIASVIPGPSDLPLKYRMFESWGLSPSEAGLSVAASGIFSIGTKLVLPLLALVVSLLASVTLASGVSGTIVIAGVILAVLIAVSTLVLGSARFTRAVGRWLDAPWRAALRMLRRDHQSLADVLTNARETALQAIAARWQMGLWGAFVSSAAQVGLMLMAVRFMGVPEDSLDTAGVFVAFGVVQGLTVVPITAGNVGVSETAWIALLGAIAGPEYINQISAAVIVYRLLTWILIIPLGGIAAIAWRRSVRS